MYNLFLQQDEEHVATKRPRPDDSEDNPAAKKRNRRMFGFLNQTLQKCKCVISTASVFDVVPVTP